MPPDVWKIERHQIQAYAHISKHSNTHTETCSQHTLKTPHAVTHTVREMASCQLKQPCLPYQYHSVRTESHGQIKEDGEGKERNKKREGSAFWGEQRKQKKETYWVGSSSKKEDPHASYSPNGSFWHCCKTYNASWQNCTTYVQRSRGKENRVNSKSSDNVYFIVSLGKLEEKMSPFTIQAAIM